MGASGFLLEDVPAEQLVDGIRMVAQGEALRAPSVTKRLIQEFSRGAVAQQSAPVELEELTPRELEVFKRSRSSRRSPGCWQRWAPPAGPRASMC